MTEFVVALVLVGWALLAVGAVSHLRHFDSLIAQLGNHLAIDRPRHVRRTRGRVAAAGLVGVELGLTAAVPAALLAGSSSVRTIVGVTGGVLGLGFTVWIARLLTSGSNLPCACSSSERPASTWSLVRSMPVMGVAGLAFVDAEASLPDGWFALAVTALAIGQAVHVLPDAMSWPDFSRRLIAAAKVAEARP